MNKTTNVRKKSELISCLNAKTWKLDQFWKKPEEDDDEANNPTFFTSMFSPKTFLSSIFGSD